MEPAVKDIEGDKDPVEVGAIEMTRKIRRIISGNIKKMSEPPYMRNFENLRGQYTNGYWPTEIFIKAQARAERAILDVGDMVVNNFTTGIGILSVFVDKYGGLQCFPVAGKKFIFDAFDALVENVDTGKINHSLDASERIVENIMEEK